MYQFSFGLKPKRLSLCIRRRRCRRRHLCRLLPLRGMLIPQIRRLGFFDEDSHDTEGIAQIFATHSDTVGGQPSGRSAVILPLTPGCKAMIVDP